MPSNQSPRVPLNLLAAEFDIKGNAGDDFVIDWIAVGLNTADWTLECKLWLANSAENGPTGEAPIETLSVDNTPGSSSTLSVTIPSDTTEEQDGVVLWMILRRTDTGAVRTLSQGPVRPL